MVFQISLSSISSYLRKSSHYILVILIFFLAIAYQRYLVPVDEFKAEGEPKKNVVPIEVPILDAKNTEKVYEHIFQSQPGDVYRIGAYVKTKKQEKIEIFAQSSLNDIFKIGEWILEPSESGGYKEIVFSAPNRYEDIVIRLRNEAATSGKDWSGAAVYIRSFFVTHVGAGNRIEMKGLQPTIFGVSVRKQKFLFEENQNKGLGNPEWKFQADGDFIDAIEFSGKVIGGGRQEYSFELSLFDSVKNEKKEQAVRSASFVLDALNSYRLPSGNYQITLSAPIKKGEWYLLSLVRVPSKDEKNFFKVGTLGVKTGKDIEGAGKEADLGLLIGSLTRIGKDVAFPEYAKLEDLGNEFVYSYDFQGNKTDYLNIFSASAGIDFDQEKRLVVGKQKNGAFFEYKFDTVYAFDKLVLEAIQHGNDEKEIKLEYSFDDTFWQEIPFVQEGGGSQKFLLELRGDGGHRKLYVRVSYNGIEKKSGFFALNELSVHASVPKYR